MQWLDGFEVSCGLACARVLGLDGIRCIDDLGSLATLGVPEGDYEWRAPFTTHFSDWKQEDAARYLAGVQIDGAKPDKHTVFSFRQGRSEFLVPALVLLRGLFPLIPDGFAYLFSPRALDVLCTPIERNGHWSVVMPDFTGYVRARYRPTSLEALTWASIYPSGRRTWASAFRGMQLGCMSVELPVAKARVLPIGIRREDRVYVTSLTVSAVLALDSPLTFASGASRSFLWTTRATPLAPNPNAFHIQAQPHPRVERLALTDSEWQVIEPLCASGRTGKGRSVRIDVRALVNGFILRAVTGDRWYEVAIPPISARNLEAAWFTWRREGRLFTVLQQLSRLRRADASFQMTVRGLVAAS